MVEVDFCGGRVGDGGGGERGGSFVVVVSTVFKNTSLSNKTELLFWMFCLLLSLLVTAFCCI